MGAGRPPKCKICGAKLSVETAYKVVTRNKNGVEYKAFYCSKEEYEEYISGQKSNVKTVQPKVKKDKPPTDRDIAYQIICDIIGRKAIINTVLWKEWKLWNNVATDEVIKLFLMENKEYLTGIISKLDNIEFNRIRYLSAILKNKLGDFKPRKETQVPQIKAEHYVTKFKPKERVALLDIEEECYE